MLVAPQNMVIEVLGIPCLVVIPLQPRCSFCLMPCGCSHQRSVLGGSDTFQRMFWWGLGTSLGCLQVPVCLIGVFLTLTLDAASKVTEHNGVRRPKRTWRSGTCVRMSRWRRIERTTGMLGSAWPLGLRLAGLSGSSCCSQMCLFVVTRELCLHSGPSLIETGLCQTTPQYCRQLWWPFRAALVPTEGWANTAGFEGLLSHAWASL